MSTHRFIDGICAAVTVLALLVTILFINGESLGLEPVVDEDAESSSGSVLFTANDLDGDWDASDAAVITLSGEGASVSGTGAYVNGGSVYISAAGKYRLTGTLTDGSIVVDAYQSSKVWLLLDSVSVTCSDSAALQVLQADKVFVTLAEGTENTLSSGTAYSKEALSDGVDGVIYSRDDLTINGSGALTVTGGYKHGMAVNDALTITGGVLTVEAAADALHTNDGLAVTGAVLNLTAGDDGLVVSEEDGLLAMESGTVTVSTQGDALNSAGALQISGGRLTLDAGDDGLHADTAVRIDGGALLLQSCYEGIEAPTIEISGGEITIYPSDDGLNANGGQGFGGGMGGFGPGGRSAEGSGTTQTSPAASSDPETVTPSIRISGGTLTVINSTGRDADGLDSNGNIEITGGTIRVSLTGGGSNSALDYGSESGGTCTISGGTVIACGASAMAEQFDESSQQCSVLCTLTSTTADGASVQLLDENGAVLLSWEAPCGFNAVSLSCPELTLGETYTVTAGEETLEFTMESASSTAGTGVGMGGFGGRGFGQSGDTARDNSEAQGDSAPGGGRSRGGGQGNSMGRGGRRGVEAGTAGAAAGESTVGGERTQRPEAAADGNQPQPPAGINGGSITQSPEGAAGGKRPEPPEGAADGETAELPEVAADSERPEPPEGAAEGQRMQRPEDMTGGERTQRPDDASENGDAWGPGGGMRGESGSGQASRQEEESATAYDTAEPVTEEQWKALALCGAVLLGGLAAALLFRRRGFV